LVVYCATWRAASSLCLLYSYLLYSEVISGYISSSLSSRCIGKPSPELWYK